MGEIDTHPVDTQKVDEVGDVGLHVHRGVEGGGEDASHGGVRVEAALSQHHPSVMRTIGLQLEGDVAGVGALGGRREGGGDRVEVVGDGGCVVPPYPLESGSVDIR